MADRFASVEKQHAGHVQAGRTGEIPGSVQTARRLFFHGELATCRSSGSADTVDFRVKMPVLVRVHHIAQVTQSPDESMPYCDNGRLVNPINARIGFTRRG